MFGEKRKLKRKFRVSAVTGQSVDKAQHFMIRRVKDVAKETNEYNVVIKIDSHGKWEEHVWPGAFVTYVVHCLR